MVCKRLTLSILFVVAADAFTLPSMAPPVFPSFASVVLPSQSSSLVSASSDNFLTQNALNAANQILEAEVLTGMAHVTLDLAVFFSRSTATLRLGAVIGRMFAIGADYIPDHTIVAEEFVFQLCMLSISVIGLVNTVLPTLLTLTRSNKATIVKDGRAFQVLFRKSGLTWFQYKSLAACNALEWVSVPPGQVITSEEDSDSTDDGVYWLYKGGISVKSKGQVVQNVTRLLAPRRNDATLGLFGEKRLIDQDIDDPYPPITVTAGDSGAILLRLRSEKLKSLMNHDTHIADAIRKLLYRSMQDKLHTFMIRG